MQREDYCTGASSVEGCPDSDSMGVGLIMKTATQFLHSDVVGMQVLFDNSRLTQADFRIQLLPSPNGTC